MNFPGKISLILILSSYFFFSHGKTYAQLNQAEKIDRFIQANLAKSSIPGLAVAVVRGDCVLVAKGYGITGANQPVTADTPFGIASLSKAFTALAVMQLVESGKINLDAPVVNYLPSFSIDDARGAMITVRQVLHQTSGLADTGFPELAFTEQPSTLDGAIARLKQARLISKPGEQFHYHNPNYQILAKVVEAVSHQPYVDYLQTHIIDPLRMTHTRDVASTRLFYTGNERITKGHIYFLGQPIALTEPEWFIDGSAGMSSSINDMAHWLTLQLNHGRFDSTQLLNKASIAMMYRPPVGTSFQYGMGWFLSSDATLYHSGILWTYSAEQLLLMKNGYGVVILFNGGLNPFVDYYSFTQGISDILTNQEPALPMLPDWVYPISIGLGLLLAIGFAIQQLFRLKAWRQRYRKWPVWRSWLYLFIRLLPLCFLLLIPSLITLLSGRVLNWERIFLMLPDVILGLAILAILNLTLVVARLLTKPTTS